MQGVSLKVLIGWIAGAALVGVMAILGISSIKNVASPQSNFQYLAQVSTQAIPEASSSVSQPPEQDIAVAKKPNPPASHTNTPAVLGAQSTKSEEATTSPVVVAKEAPPPVAEKSCSFTTNQFPNYRGMIINEVGWMGSSANSNHEWIELKNISGSQLDISNWQLVDKAEQIKVRIPPQTRLSVGGFFIAERDEAALPTIKADAVYVGALSNSNEALRLFDQNCFLIDEVSASPEWPAGDADAKRSMERSPNYEWHTYLGSGSGTILGTPKAENSLPPAPAPVVVETPSSSAPVEPILAPTSMQSEPTSTPAVPEQPTQVNTPAGSLFISEVMVGTEASANDEFIELYNTTGSDIALTGYSIKKKTSSGAESSLVATSRFEGKVIPAGKHFLITHDGSYAGAVAGDITFPASYSLAYTNNTVLLYDANNQKISEVSWTEISKGQSYACSAPVSCSTQTTPGPQNSSN
jgi:hypothetical protein